jgi:hypothetical protein
VIFQSHAVKLVKPIPNKAEMCYFTSADYEDMVLENVQNDCIVVAKRNPKKEIVIAKQEGKLKLYT